jgi:hypothetical protein
MRNLHIIRAPSGRFIFVGAVPACLAVEASDADLIDTARHAGMGIARGIAAKRGGFIRTLSWDTEADARAAAVAAGFAPA